jgi:hypothetical protein
MFIGGMDRALILAALYNRAQVQGMGFLQAKPGSMTVREAREILSTGQTYFDYLYGRVMKINLNTNDTDTRMYNRNNGTGAAEKVMSDLRAIYQKTPEKFDRGNDTWAPLGER